MARRKLITIAAVVALGLSGPSEGAQASEPKDARHPDTESQPLDAANETDTTADSETEGTIDLAVEQAEAERRWSLAADVRPIFAATEVEARSGTTVSDEELGLRARLNVVRRLSRTIRLGAGLAGRCTTRDCSLEFVLQRALPGENGLLSGQITFDELFGHWYRSGVERRLDLLVGRFQTRYVLRGGVYAKSLDRNDSNNTRITWTDGFLASFRGRRGWRADLVWQFNHEDGSGSIRRGPLDFGSNAARSSFFIGLENLDAWGPFVQRSLDVSYLPDSLLKDDDREGRRVDYWNLVGRLAVRWPQRSQAMRFRGGVEIGLAPETPTLAASGFDGAGDVGGLAWNVVANAMDFARGHSIGVNYGRTQAGWLLSPQFFPNSELFEVRYRWRPANGPMLEARVRKQQELDRLASAQQRGRELDFYLRLTWEIGKSTTRLLR